METKIQRALDRILAAALILIVGSFAFYHSKDEESVALSATESIELIHEPEQNFAAYISAYMEHAGLRTDYLSMLARESARMDHISSLTDLGDKYCRGPDVIDLCSKLYDERIRIIDILTIESEEKKEAGDQYRDSWRRLLDMPEP